MDAGPAAAMEIARDCGAAVVVAHPYELGPTPGVRSPTRYFSRNWRKLDGLFDRVGWVAKKGLPPVACADLHREDQFPGWTTLVSCEKDPDALVSTRGRLPTGAPA